MRDTTPLFWMGGAGWLLALLLGWAWWAGLRFVRLLKDMPTVPIRGVFVGLVETTGRARMPQPLRGGLTGAPCVHHAWSVDEHWRRTETYRDKDGKTRTRTVTGSDTVASGGESADFTLVDDHDSIAVRVDGASWRPLCSLSTTVGRGDALYHSQAPDVVVRGSTGQRTFTEHVVPVEVPLFLVGSAGIAESGAALEVRREPEEDDLLIISTGNERSLVRGRRAWAVALFILGGLFAAAGSAVLSLGWWQGEAGPGMGLTEAERTRALWTGALLGAGAFLLMGSSMWIVIVRNGVVRVRTRWQRAASLVDVQLKRRADLLPNLVAVTQGYAHHEQATQKALAAMRAGAASGPALTALVEAYPQLMADGAFLRLQAELVATEDRIALARHFEVESRAAFLDRLRTFPEGTIARLLGVAAPPPELGRLDSVPSSR